MSSTRTQSQLCTATAISSLCPVFTFHFGHCFRQSPHLVGAKSRRGNHVSSRMKWYIWYSPLKDFWSSNRKLAWVGLEPLDLNPFTPEWDYNPWLLCIYICEFIKKCYSQTTLFSKQKQPGPGNAFSTLWIKPAAITQSAHNLLIKSWTVWRGC